MDKEAETPDLATLAEKVAELEKRVALLENEIKTDHETLEHDHELLERLDSELHSKGEGPSPVGL